MKIAATTCAIFYEKSEVGDFVDFVAVHGGRILVIGTPTLATVRAALDTLPSERIRIDRLGEAVPGTLIDLHA